MQFPARFSDLPEYAFPRLRRLLEGMPPGGPELAMTIGEPKHPLPAIVGRDRRRARRASSPSTRRTRAPPSSAPPSPAGSAAATASRSTPTPRSIALNGTREGLFNAALALSPETQGRRAGRRC